MWREGPSRQGTRRADTQCRLLVRSDRGDGEYANGVLVRHRNEGPTNVRWHTPSLAPLSAELKVGQSNEIVVRILNMVLAGGLWRGVRVVEPKK